jgi:two-component system cell cycle sensor histidine kinase/response regulator CckA
MAAGDWIALSVQDTGTGIPEDALAHIYEPFFTTKDVGKGTGLGLSQVYGLVKQNGGYIDCESAVGQGTRMIVYLPPCPRSGARAAGAPEGIPTGHGETILVVEDEPSVRAVTRAMLELLQYHVAEADNGLAALDLCYSDETPVDLVLTDIVMPDMSGPALAAELRKTRPELPVVMVTGYPLDDDSRKCLAGENARWLQKPVRPDDLARTVAEALRSRRDAPS